MLIEACNKYSIDAMILSETNIKQSISNHKKMRNKLSKLNKNIELIIADSRDYELTSIDQLPGGIITCLWGQIVLIINSSKTYRDKLGQWIACHITNGTKKLLLILIYCIP